MIYYLKQRVAIRCNTDRKKTLSEHIDYHPYIIYRCVIGSRAYGLEHESSDTDRRGIYLPPADLQWSFKGVPEQLENNTTQETYWEMEKFLLLALKANPAVLECLYTPLVETHTPLIDEMLAMREAFLSKIAFHKFNGYAREQFKKLEIDVRQRGTPRWKHAMHMIRILLAGITLLQEGYLPIIVTEHRDQLLAISGGEMPWREVDAWRVDLHRQFEKAFAQSKLPENPDFDRVTAFLVKARRSMVDKMEV